jgi:iron(III) transport system permease protein
MALAEFAVPMFLRYPVHSVESFTRFAAFYQPGAAAAAAVPLASTALLVLAIERVLLRERTYEVRFARSTPLAAPLGALAPLLVTGVAAAALVTVALPLGSLAMRAAEAEAFRQAVVLGWRPMVRSFGYAVAGATLLTVVGFPLGYAIQRRRLAHWRTVDTLTILLFALPSTVIGVGLVALWNRPSGALIYGTMGLVLVGYLAQFTALTSRISVAGVSALHPSLEEAARLSGAGWLRTMWSVVGPLAARTLAVAWLVAYLFCIRDTGVTMMTYPPGGDTLPVRTFTLMANGAPSLIAALCMMMIGTSVLPVFVAWPVIARRRAAAP